MAEPLEPDEESVSVPPNGPPRFLRWKLALGDEGKLTFVVPSDLAVEAIPDPQKENDDGSVL